MKNGKIIVQATDLVKAFAQPGTSPVMAVQGVSLTLHAGQLIHIMGPSGSGKTTLLSMLGMLIPPTSGRLEILGEMTAGMSQPALTSLRLRTIGFVFQNFQLIDALTVTENVELPMNFVDIRRPHSTTRAKRLLEELGLSTKCHFRPRVLSGGEKQRVAIARAFANYPPLIFADEPTGSLDSHTGQSVIELLRNAADKRGTAVLVVSHDPRIRGYADQVLQMEDGMLHDTNSESVESINEPDRV